MFICRYRYMYVCVCVCMYVVGIGKQVLSAPGVSDAPLALVWRALIMIHMYR